MLFDDVLHNLLFLRKVLKNLGFSGVDEAASGRKAIELAQQNTYDLIFMDCQMPEIDGFEAATMIREREEKIGDIKIIAVTADAIANTARRSFF
ncbi:MAG TPA: response regulator [Alphaproteobacteria bacterium]|nr:response regulator [Alphaproteobacteria bacterium]